MLIQPDGLLDERENVIKEREELLAQVSNRKIGGQAELENQERSAGPRLAYTEVIRRIQKCNNQIQVRDGSLGNVALYFPKTKGEYQPDDPVGTFFGDHKYVGGMPKESLPEFSHVILDSSNLPVREYRGWRSVLISLIKSGAINYVQAVKQFGEPQGPRAARWFEQLHEYKGKYERN